MGFFDFLKKDTKDTAENSAEASKELPLFSPVEGELIPIEEVKDQVFSQKMLGGGFAVIPSADTIYSPVRGKVFSVFETKHAVTLKSGSLEVLVHLGLDTVELKGAPFETTVNEGDSVNEEQVISHMDRAQVEAAGKDPVVIVVFTNEGEIAEKLDLRSPGPVKAGENIGTIFLK